MKKYLHRVLLAVLTVTIVCLFSTVKTSAQIPATGGTYTVDTISGNTFAGGNTGNFKSFKRAFAALNSTAANFIAGSVSFNVTAGQTFVETPSTITYTNLNAASPIIIFQTSGIPGTNNPVLSGTSGSGPADYIVEIKGGNHYTFNGISLYDNPANNTANAEMEVGIYMTPASGFGCTNDTIMNCKFLMNNTNPNKSYAVRTVVNSGSKVANTNNSFLNNDIEGADYGYSLENNNTVAPADSNNQIGTISGGTSIINNIGTTSVNGIAINLFTQTNFSVFNNTITNVSGNGSVCGVNLGSNYAQGAGQIYANSMNALVSTGSVYGINVNTGNDLTTNIYSNTINNISSNSVNGDIDGIRIAGGTTVSINDNYIHNALRTSSSVASNGTQAGIEIGTNDEGSTNLATVNILGNTIFNIRCWQIEGSNSSYYNEIGGILIGPSGSAMPSALNVSFNTVAFVTDSAIANDYQSGIGVKASASSSSGMPGAVFSNNIIHDVFEGGTGNREMAGLKVLGCTGAQIFNNLIYNIYNTAAAGAIITGLDDDCESGGAYNAIVYNNVIFGVYALSGNNNPSVVGLGIHQPAYTYTSAGINGIHRVYYNSVYLDSAQAPGTTGYTAAFYSDNNGTANGLDYRNNIFINNVNVANAGAGARAFAFYYNSSSYTGILASGTASDNPNNNLLYAGTPGPKNYIFYNGSTTYQTLAEYQTAIQTSGLNRETQAVTLSANTPATLFVNIGALPYDLHLQMGATDAIQKGTLPLATPYLTDHDGNPRPIAGATNTSIGAYEPFSVITGIAGIEGKNEFVVFPNPVTDELTIEVLNNFYSLKQILITDALGRTVLQQITGKQTMQVDVHSFAAGIYFVKGQMNDGSLQVKKFVKQ